MFIENCPFLMKFYRFTTLSTLTSVYHSPAFFFTASFTLQDQLHCHCVNVMQNATCHQKLLHLPTLSILTQAGSSLKTSVIKPSFKEKKNRKSRRLSFAAVPATALTIHLYSRHQRQATSSVRNRLFSCYFLLEQHLYTSLLIENLDFQLCGAGHLLFFHVINPPPKGRVSTKGPVFCNCFQDAFL